MCVAAVTTFVADMMGRRTEGSTNNFYSSQHLGEKYILDSYMERYRILYLLNPLTVDRRIEVNQFNQKYWPTKFALA